jgi:hypothetical protein
VTCFAVALGNVTHFLAAQIAQIYVEQREAKLLVHDHTKALAQELDTASSMELVSRWGSRPSRSPRRSRR